MSVNTNVNIWGSVSCSMSMVITALPAVHSISQMFYRRVMTPVHDPVRLSLRLYWTCAHIFYLIFHSSYHSPCISLMQGVNVFYNLVFEQKQKVSAIVQCALNEQHSLILLGQHEIVSFYSFIYMFIYFQVFHNSSMFKATMMSLCGKQREGPSWAGKSKESFMS